ncbi:M48 family metallopeptidase [Nitrosomonas sp.]|uniref:M48 family metallopeptidase n=1 Tax=Nitrosomonas sp. TaxID=42353 RepID=UPI001D5998B7|nr:M48 family metallopeptidase [Nitrosomonas sp.]MCB1949649.1 M48 family metallopeptidase [Nitrosomonas sp.]MCP5244303.1 M48 family metallopeptidase [Burkholderiales bacterium]MDR4513915.1 M48 family metallopeptidase [Nitrosomonas sp.]
MQTFTLIFIAALLLTVSVQIWLSLRHIRHIRAHQSKVPEEFASQISLADHSKAAEYTCAKTRVGYPGIFLHAGILLFLTLGGGLNVLSEYWSGWIGDPIIHGMALIMSTFLIMSLLEIPLSYYRTFVIEEKFGFNKMTPGMFFADLIKQGLLMALLGAPLLFCILWLMEKTGEHWWLYAWAAWMTFNLFILAIYPAWIAPMFNQFTPLEDATLKTRIEKLMQKCGFKSSGLFVMDGSRRSKHGNAYFTGFGKTKRIVFFDTLLSSLEPKEIEAVLAHELGHFKHRHVIKRITLSFVLSLVFFWLLGFLMNQSWFYEGLGVTATSVPQTAMALLLFFLVMPVFTFLLHPISSIYSRKHEFEADAYAAKNSSADYLISALVKLYQDNAATLTPDPLHSSFYDSHPPAAIRVAHLQNQMQS